MSEKSSVSFQILLMAKVFDSVIQMHPSKLRVSIRFSLPLSKSCFTFIVDKNLFLLRLRSRRDGIIGYDIFGNGESFSISIPQSDKVQMFLDTPDVTMSQSPFNPSGLNERLRLKRFNLFTCSKPSSNSPNLQIPQLIRVSQLSEESIEVKTLRSASLMFMKLMQLAALILLSKSSVSNCQRSKSSEAWVI